MAQSNPAQALANIRNTPELWEKIVAAGGRIEE